MGTPRRVIMRGRCPQSDREVAYGINLSRCNGEQELASTILENWAAFLRAAFLFSRTTASMFLRLAHTDNALRRAFSHEKGTLG